MNKCDCGGEAVSLPHYEWCSSLKKTATVIEHYDKAYGTWEYFTVPRPIFEKKLDFEPAPIPKMFDGCCVVTTDEAADGFIEACCNHAQSELHDVKPPDFEQAAHRVLTIVRVNCPVRCLPIIVVNDKLWAGFEAELAKTTYRSRDDEWSRESSPLDIERFYAAAESDQNAHFGYDIGGDAFACWCGERLSTNTEESMAWLIDYKIAEFCTLHASCKRGKRIIR